MRWYRGLTSIALALLLLTGVSCTSDITGVDTPVVHETSPEPTLETSMLLGNLLGGAGDLLGRTLELLGGVVSELLNVTGLLDCSKQGYAITSQYIGAWGGSIRVGEHVLVIPRGALTRYVRITAEQIPGSTNSVRFSPEGLQFQKPAYLTLNYENCRNVELPKAIVYTDESLKVIEILRSFDLFKKLEITAPIDHFSRYAVAY
jgi:hypothetical protein